jgi:hypothetical protein
MMMMAMSSLSRVCGGGPMMAAGVQPAPPAADLEPSTRNILLLVQ